MKRLLCVIVAAIALASALSALAQSAPTTAPAVPAPTAAPVNPAAAEPVATSKKFACQTASQGRKGQERQDMMQLCIAQARLDCLKQAIDQKIVGPQRRDFVKRCVQE
jgi:curli biogenesis system outer membrane secretion channel CsgG